MTEMGTDPRIEYARRLKHRRAAAARRESWHRRIGNTRLAVFLAAAATAWFVFKLQLVSPWWLLIPACSFIALVAWHGRVLQELQQFERAVEFYERGFGRLEERWEGAGTQGERFKDPSHPYAQDLDLFGRSSLFELLCSARTQAGEQMLASWLKSPASLEEIRSRQGAVDELRSDLDLREDLAVLGADVGAAVRADPLLQWGQGTGMLPSTPARILTLGIALLSLSALAIWVTTGRHLWFFLMVLIEALFVFCRRRAVGEAVSGAEKAGRDLQLLSLLLARLEKQDFKADHLRKLRAALDREGMPPSRRIARLNSLIILLDSRRNMLFAPIAFILQWEMQLAFFVEQWRRNNGQAIAGWLAAVAELEALSSLAGYAYEHPKDPFPELSEQSPCFDGRGLGHPLLSESKCVRNDVSLVGEVQALVVSGSNMSGKSTLLRTVGINAVLALAGAPVRADRLRIAPLALGASIRIMDSLQQGTSRFYSEITRLRKLVTLAEGPIPLLFLLDELLQGTNSHDRRIGAEALVRGLVHRGAIGLLTTHDLALAHIAEVLAPHAVNVHFEDHIEDGRMAFDYRLRPGIVTKSNALELMRSIGLDV
jgi:tetratricopeptide (TPR) repeat protein